MSAVEPIPTCELVEWAGEWCGAPADGWLDSPVRGPVAGCWRCAYAVSGGEPSRWAWREVEPATGDSGPGTGQKTRPESDSPGLAGAPRMEEYPPEPTPRWLITPESLRGLSRAEVLERLRAFVDAAEAVAS
jgi:hypothetical protein